jgi:hypothetical protein
MDRDGEGRARVCKAAGAACRRVVGDDVMCVGSVATPVPTTVPYSWSPLAAVSVQVPETLRVVGPVNAIWACCSRFEIPKWLASPVQTEWNSPVARLWALEPVNDPVNRRSLPPTEAWARPGPSKPHAKT